MIKAVSFGSQETTAQENKKPSVVVPTIVGGGIGGVVTGITPLGKSPQFKDHADFFEKSDKAKEALDAIKDDDKKADKQTLEDALNTAKKDSKDKVDNLFKGDIKEVDVNSVLSEIEHKPSIDDLKATIDKTVDDVFKTRQEQFDAYKKVGEELKNGEEKQHSDTVKISKDSEGKVTVAEGKMVDVPGSKEFKLTEGAKAETLPVEVAAHPDYEAINKIATENLKDDVKETIQALNQDKAVKVSKDANGKIMYEIGVNHEKPVFVADKDLDASNFKSLKELNEKFNNNLDSSKKIKEAVAKGIKEGEPITVAYDEAGHMAQITKKGKEINIEYGTMEKGFFPKEAAAELKAPVVLDDFQKQIKAEAEKLTTEKPSTIIDHADGKQKIKINKTDAGVTYEIGNEVTTEAAKKFEGTAKNLDDISKELSDQKTVFQKNKNIADALGFTKDKAPDKVNKEVVEKAFNKASSTFGENVKTAFNNLQKQLGTKPSWGKIAIGTAACMLVSGVTAHMIGNKNNDQ